MRFLPPPLAAAQGSPSAVPYLRVTVSPRTGGVARASFQRLYSGPETDGPHAAALAGDGSLLRARIADGQLYYQRVPSPGPGSPFGSWTPLASAQRSVALAALGAQVLLAYVTADGSVSVRESQDYGATFGPAVTVLPSSAAAQHLALALKAGEALLAYATPSQVSVLKRTGGVWGSPSAWPHALGSVSGLACHYGGDYNLAVTGTETGGRAGVWAAAFGDGYRQGVGTWSPLREVQRADAGTGVAFAAPCLSAPDVYRLGFLESYSGSQPYARLQLSHLVTDVDFADNWWREPLPSDIASAHGVAMAGSGTALWLSAPAGVWRADLSAPALDVSYAVLALEVEEAPWGGRLRVQLSDDGTLSAPDGPLQPGAEVAVSLGYFTAQGPQASPAPRHWLTAVEVHSEGGRRTVTLDATSAWGLLRAWRARRQFAWAAGERNVFGILSFLWARAGVPFSTVSYSQAAVDLRPAFTVQPGQSGLEAVRRLLALVPDVVLLSQSYALLKHPLETETPSYAYGDGHPILAAAARRSLAAANRVQVFGQGTFAEAFLWDDIALSGDRLLQVHDLNLATGPQAADRALWEARRLRLSLISEELTVPTNCVQELYDVVTVTEPSLGLAGARRRVLSIRTSYDARRGLYRQRLGLGAP
ncbi:MAG TPA: hypothetical protein VNL95_05390 [Dehalococcoidia bacterium]|nr:hypothetical protein [Dehalococcoidia bacterium]